MSAPLPREPRPGERLDADWGRAVALALRSMRLRGGPGVRVSSGPDGTTVSVGRGAPGAEEAVAAALPLDLSLAVSGDGRTHALLRIAGFAALRGADAIPVDSARCPGLAAAVSGGAESWDAGAVSGAMGFCLYVAESEESGEETVASWGVATGSSVAAAAGRIPQEGVLLALPIGAVSPGEPPLQLFHGCVALAGGSMPDGTEDGDLLKWNASDGIWEAYEPEEVTVVTDVVYDTSSHRIRKKTRTMRAILPGRETTETIEGGQAVEHSGTLDGD